MVRVLSVVGLGVLAYTGRRHLVHLLTRLTGTWLGAPDD
jgi:hypothetical protein